MALLTADDVVPQLTTIAKPDGFQFELMLNVGADEKEITRVRIGPYHFKDEFRPKAILGGLIASGGPESAFWMHKNVPPRWSRPKWVIAEDEPDQPLYLEWNGHLAPGDMGVIRFISIYPPGGLRAGLVIYRGQEPTYYGVTGPNYEQFEIGSHDH
ncbi:MAG TPA: hypothetical protein VGK19_06030 [Capsulimonadaceae bacterium]